LFRTAEKEEKSADYQFYLGALEEHVRSRGVDRYARCFKLIGELDNLWGQNRTKKKSDLIPIAEDLLRAQVLQEGDSLCSPIFLSIGAGDFENDRAPGLSPSRAVLDAIQSSRCPMRLKR